MSDATTTEAARPPIAEARRLSKDPLDHDFECERIFYPAFGSCDCWPIDSRSIVRSQRQVRLALRGSVDVRPHELRSSGRC